MRFISLTFVMSFFSLCPLMQQRSLFILMTRRGDLSIPAIRVREIMLDWKLLINMIWLEIEQFMS